MRVVRTRHQVLVGVSLTGAVIAASAFQAFELPNVGSAVPASDFMNFESAHVHPLDMTPDGTKLLAVNTANNSLEVFQITAHELLNVASIPVGLDPVTVRVRSNTEAWVVDQVSDEVSIVDLTQNVVVRSLATEDEPADVVFAGTPQKAFVSCGGKESIQVFDPANLGNPPTEVLLEGELPRAMAVSPDGSTVYTAFFESGNQTTVVPGNTFAASGVCSPQGGCTNISDDVINPAGPYGGALNAAAGIVPNAGTGFDPPLNPLNPPTDNSHTLIVRKNASGQWMDDNNHDWSTIITGGVGVRTVGWDMPDRDVAMLNANSLALTYKTHLGNILMAMAVNPADGKVSVVGTDATNQVRFEPNLNGKFLRVNISQFTSGGSPAITDLNPHLTYTSSSVPQAQRELSVGDPRGIAWLADGSKAYITGMGSNNVIAVDASGARVGGGAIAVGEGPTGIVIDGTRDRFYVLNKFEGTISTVDMATEKEIARANFFDPTPQVIKAGRRVLYGTLDGSGTGHIACASCHVDARWDRLGWDLGDPSADMQTVDGKSFHPLKGVKTTQFLVDIIDHGRGNLHWRGDKHEFADFADAFHTLQGRDAPMDPGPMQEFADFLAETWYVPNPYRTYRPESSVAAATERCNPNRVRGIGTTFQSIPSAGVKLFVSMNLNCANCHNAQTGRGDLAGDGFVAGGVAPNTTGFVANRNMAADLRSTYRKNGFFYNTTSCNVGFGMLADGIMETWFNETGTGNYLGDYEPELLSWSGGITPANCSACLNTANFPLASTDVHDAGPAVGLRETINAAQGSTAQLTIMKNLVNDYGTQYGMIVKGMYQGEFRGFYYIGSDNYQSDIAGQTVTHAQLVNAAQAGGSPLSWTIVGANTAVRMGVDRDSNGILDHDDHQAMVNLRANMEGAYDGTAMRSDLRDNGVLPNTDPYGMGVQANPDVLAFTGLASPVDWAMVELRDNSDPSVVVDSKPVLVQRSGNLMDATGEQTIVFAGVPAGDYHVVVRHRNHLGVMTYDPVLLQDMGTLIDFTEPATATWGTNAQKNDNGVMVAWMGDVTGDGVIKYTGANNDRDPILVRIGGTIPTATANGYYPEDVNLNGTVKYTGASNDRDPILQTIGGSLPTNVKVEQVP
ncbi:MAG: beta-propeller fold lactonase family protein [Flavobacteriales bacterium]|nr:beta-propeller fold lactonase family protein [Flavobacteriales bacterium]MCB9166764.1 beta-propeller fold lactonase family protein [Flavobacteriales bacterium]